jgi:hypothetical protein
MILKPLKPREALNSAFLQSTILKSQIDQLVYELYGLTEEKIEIVENG